MPIRIRGGATPEAITPARTLTTALTKQVTAQPTFADQLANIQTSQARQDLDRLHADVEEQGRRLLEEPTPEQFAKYRRIVGEFVHYVVKKALKLKSTISSRELHQIIERVDEELLTLADAVLVQERPLMEIAARIDQINGMLLDLKV